VFNALSHSSWNTNAAANINQAAASVRIYKMEYGEYPKTMAEAFGWNNTRRANELAILPGCPDSHYELRVLSNGFALAVVRPGGVFRSEWKVSRDFMEGR
jgi:hypothetical protein